MWNSAPEVIGLDCTDCVVKVVRLSVGEKIQLLEQPMIKGIEGFVDYWYQLLKQSHNLFIVAEDHPNDPSGIIPLVERQFTVDRHHVAFRHPAYDLPFQELGIGLDHRRAGTLALNKAYQIRASECTRVLIDHLSDLRGRLAAADLEAARLFLALNSSIYIQASNNF